jgi:hypothetical protein
MLRGYSVSKMLQILERWDTLTDAEKAELGFTDSPQKAASETDGLSRLN